MRLVELIRRCFFFAQFFLHIYFLSVNKSCDVFLARKINNKLLVCILRNVFVID